MAGGAQIRKGSSLLLTLGDIFYETHLSIRQLRGDSLKKIAEQYRINKYSSVSSVIERMEALIIQDRRLRKRVEKLTRVKSRPF
jgi:hypothetical protein